MLSIILPTIRLDRLPKFLESLNNSYHGEYELIFVSPYEKPSFMPSNTNWIIDKGSPTRCQQIGLCQSKGEYIHRAVDDSFYEPNSLDKAMALVNYNTVVNMRYTESNNTVDSKDRNYINMTKDEFYKFGYHKLTLSPYVPQDADLINFAIYPALYLKDLGGWNSYFETIALAETDLSIRINFSGINVVLTQEVVLKCDWMPGKQGDHGPMDEGFKPDLDKYYAIYSDIVCWEQLNIPLDNWKNYPDVWERRFGNV